MGIFPEDDPVTIVCLEHDQAISNHLTEWCDSDDDLRAVSDVKSALNELDNSVDVVVVGPQLSDVRVASAIRAHPYFGRLMMVAETVDDEQESQHIDIVLEQPVSREDIHQVIEKLVIASRRSQYEQTILDLLTEKIYLDETEPTTVLNDHDRYQQLIEMITTRLERLNVRVVPTTSKYRPSTCPQCGIRWDLRVGSTTGYHRISSYSWKCSSCGEVVPNINSFDRAVAK